MLPTRRLVVLLVVVLLALPTMSRASRAEEIRDLTILHTASTFNRIQEFSVFKTPPQGGVARRATVVQELRKAHANTLLLSAGSDVMGTPMFAQYGGVASAQVMSPLKDNAAL